MPTPSAAPPLARLFDRSRRAVEALVVPVADGVSTVIAPATRRGWLAPGPVGLGVVQLETTGRRSGRPIERPLVALRVGERMVVGTARRRSDWIANVTADPAPAVRTRAGRRTVHAARVRWHGTSLVLLHPRTEEDR